MRRQLSLYPLVVWYQRIYNACNLCFLLFPVKIRSILLIVVFISFDGLGYAQNLPSSYETPSYITIGGDVDDDTVVGLSVSRVYDTDSGLFVLVHKAQDVEIYLGPNRSIVISKFGNWTSYLIDIENNNTILQWKYVDKIFVERGIKKFIKESNSPYKEELVQKFINILYEESVIDSDNRKIMLSRKKIEEESDSFMKKIGFFNYPISRDIQKINQFDYYSNIQNLCRCFGPSCVVFPYYSMSHGGEDINLAIVQLFGNPKIFIDSISCNGVTKIFEYKSHVARVNIGAIFDLHDDVMGIWFSGHEYNSKKIINNRIVLLDKSELESGIKYRVSINNEDYIMASKIEIDRAFMENIKELDFSNRDYLVSDKVNLKLRAMEEIESGVASYLRRKSTPVMGLVK